TERSPTPRYTTTRHILPTHSYKKYSHIRHEGTILTAKTRSCGLRWKDARYDFSFQNSHSFAGLRAPFRKRPGSGGYDCPEERPAHRRSERCRRRPQGEVSDLRRRIEPAEIHRRSY